MIHDSRSSVVMDTDLDPEKQPVEMDPDDPFCILVLGDFSGRVNRGLNASMAGRHPVAVDLDNFDDVIARLKPALRLPYGELQFRELDDFHPDHLYRHLEAFSKLDRLLPEEPPKSALSSPSAPPAVIPPNFDVEMTGAGLLDSIVEQTSEATGAVPVRQVVPRDDLANFIQSAVAPYTESKPDAAQRERAARKQSAATQVMRAVLHHPDFQALEAAWRSLWMLVRGLADDVRIFLLDATVDELMADPAASEKLIAGARDPWALLIGNYAFGENREDAQRLLKLGRMARAAGAPFLAEAQPPGGGEVPEDWEALRRSAMAKWIGLALPRFLLRLPYGPETSEIDAFAFEEMEGSVHQDYLWGNPAICCAYLIGQTFRSEGWQLRPGIHRQIDDLPLHTYRDGAETVNKPCAEVLLSEHDAEMLIDMGYMPLASMKNQDSVRVVRFQSIRDPLAPLAGRWT